MNTKAKTKQPTKAPATKASSTKAAAAPAKPLDMLNQTFECHYPNKWMQDVKDAKGKQALHWGTLGEALTLVNVKMYSPDGKLVSFKEAIAASKAASDPTNGVNHWQKWYQGEMNAYQHLFASGKASKLKHGKHIESVISVLKRAGYTFK